jgi:3-methyladenine DNA glycosylase AlkD
MARFGIHPRTTVLGVPMGALRRLGREIGTDHGLALQLWRSGIHEARILAALA